MQPIIPSRPLFPPTWTSIKPVLRVIIYPWGIWSIIGTAVQWARVKANLFGRAARIVAGVVHAFLFAAFGLPLIVLVTGEILIWANKIVVGEEATYKLQDNTVWWRHDVKVPGPKTPDVAAVDDSDRERYHRYLIERYAPVFIQKISYQPAWDIPVRLDFDGDLDPRNNVANAAAMKSLPVSVHAEVTAETKDSFYLLYSLYHIRDYDHPVRQILSSWTYHDNDNEGLMLRVDKKTMRVVQGEGWFHNRFFLANLGEKGRGDEPVQGTLYFENGYHTIVYVQSMGHGVRFTQPFDIPDLSKNVKVLRFRGNRKEKRPLVDRSAEHDITYDLVSFDDWYRFAQGPLGARGAGSAMFEERITLGRQPDGTPLVVGRFIAGLDYAKHSWSRPKPPWSWDDGWDRIPIAVWHFYPSFAFQSHFGTPLSDHYIYNRPIDKIFGEDPNSFMKKMHVRARRRSGPKWGGTIKEKQMGLTRRAYLDAVNLYYKQYINRLFRALG